MAEKNIQETAASETIVPKGDAESVSKTGVLAIIMGQLSQLPLDDINGFAASISQVGQESSVIPDGSSENNAATILAKPSFAVGTSASIVGQEAFRRSVNEDLDEILKGQEINDETKEKYKTLFEAAVGARSILEASKMKELFEEELANAEAELTEEMVEKVNKYLDYVVEEWLAENEVAIESSVEKDLTVSFMAGLKQLFEDHYIEIPEDKADVVAELADRVAELEEALNEKIQENIDLEIQKTNNEKDSSIEKVTEGLNLSEKDKLRNLCEGIEYTNNDEFMKKAEIIKKQYFTKEDNNKSQESLLLAEQMSVDEVRLDSNGDVIQEEANKASNPEMQIFVDAISRTAKAG